MLKNLTQTFKDNCNAREVILSEYVILDNIKIPIKAELNDDCYNEGNFIGTFIFKELRFETSNEYDFKKKEFKYYKVVNGESVKIGTFITTEITDNDTEETIKVVAMDYGLKTQVEYTSNLNYGSGNITLLDVWNENCELSGIESGITSFTNSNFIVDSDQFSGTGATRRDVFIAIAQSSCDFVKVANDDKIYLILKEETNEVIEEYTDLEDKRDTQPINAVSLGMSQVEGEILTKIADGVSEENANWLVINDNPFAYTQEKRQQLINGIFNKINGFGYSAFKTETSFKPYLTCGDLVKFKRKDGVLVDSIILRYKHNFDNITLEAPSIVKTTVNYTKPVSAIDVAKKVEIIVNKQENTIENIVKNIGENGEITGASLILAINNDKSEAKLNADVIELTANDILNLLANNSINLTSKSITINSEKFNVDENGNVVANSFTSNNASITGGDFKITSTENNPKFQIVSQYEDIYSILSGASIRMFNGGKQLIDINALLGAGLIALRSNIDEKITLISPYKVETPKIEAGNIDTGICTLNSNNVVSVDFNKEFENIPNVSITPYTSASGVIAPKIRSISTTGFTAIIGGSGFSNIECSWIAIG